MVFRAQARTLLIGMGRGFAPRESDDTAVVPPIYHERGAEAPIENLGGRCSVGAHFSRAPARPFQPDGGGASPRENRTTRRSSLQGHRRLRSASSPAPPPSTAALRLLLPSSFLLTSGQLISRTAGQTEADADAAVVRVVVVVAVGDSAAVRTAAPAAAAEATVGGRYNILAPLPHIPTHVINT